LYGVLRVQARLARRAIGPADDIPPDASGSYGRFYPGDAVSLAMLGDSSAAGYGVDRVEDTPGAQLAAGLTELAQRPVRLTSLASVGARTADLAWQIDQAVRAAPAAAVILVGANDVTHRVAIGESVQLLAAAVRRLIGAGCVVVVGTCPDLGTVRPIPPPLRQLARYWSRQLAAAQTVAGVEAGARTVSMSTALGPEFDAAPAELFGPDRFHPSAAGYASVAAALLPSVAAALGLVPTEEEEPEPLRGEGVLPVAYAAVEAANTSGTEVARAQVDGQEQGPRGRWALLRHRRHRPPPDVERAEREARGEPARDEAGGLPQPVASGTLDTPDPQEASDGSEPLRGDASAAARQGADGNRA
jgi:lysophospholipase L1-like esterase